MEQTADDLDLINRDPNNMNDNVKVMFDETFGEPEGIRSADCLWRNSFRCFSAWKSICYHINTIFCGLCVAMCWGCEFAQIAFMHVWCIVPCLRCLDINAKCAKKFTGLCCWCLINPVCEALTDLIRTWKSR